MVSGKNYYDDQTVERIKQRIEKDEETGCWEWQGAKSSAGYPQIRVNKEQRYVHRVMQEEYNKSLTDEKPFTCHKCDNPSCVNPDHLFRGSHQDNMDDAAEKGRMNGPSYEGDEHHQSKLNSEQVKRIREDYATGEYTQKDLADKYGVVRTQVSSIVRGENWQSAGGPVLSEKQRRHIESKVRSKPRPHKQGENHHRAKITEEDVIRIREKYHNEGVYQKELAEEYDTSRGNIGNIVRGDSWSHAGGPTGGTDR